MQNQKGSQIYKQNKIMVLHL